MTPTAAMLIAAKLLRKAELFLDLGLPRCADTLIWQARALLLTPLRP